MLLLLTGHEAMENGLVSEWKDGRFSVFQACPVGGAVNHNKSNAETDDK